MKRRYLSSFCADDLAEKLVFIGGPRQVGKTTLALQMLGNGIGSAHPAYLNWDIELHKRKILRNEIPGDQPLLVFDEIHKYRRWRSLIKGFYDQFYPRRRAVVTGSARLDHYRKGGDSLQGRYHYYRLHPFSLRELNHSPNLSDLKALLEFGGFPEPFLRQDRRAWRRWHVERLARVLKGDLLDLEHVTEVSMLELLSEALPSKVGSPLSLQSLRLDLQVSHDSIRRWLNIFENLYLCFRIPPFGAPRIRAVKKEQKLYLWDWSSVSDPGARFENLVASQLLKFCHLQEDAEGYRMELRYLRDTDGREVDFVVVRERKPVFAVECKSGEASPSRACQYFRERTSIPKFYQVHLGTKDFGDASSGTRVLPFTRFVQELELP